LFGILLAIMSLTMGRGLSPLQKDILAVLEEFPAREDFPEEGTISLSSWAHPRQIPATAEAATNRIKPHCGFKSARSPCGARHGSGSP
jgi:hypothetical protein